MSKTMRTFLLLALVVPLLSGCLGGPVPKDNFYRLLPMIPQRILERPALKGIIEVQRFSAEGLSAGRELVYSKRDDPQSIQTYGYHLWSDPPAVQIQDVLVRYLRAARAADTVVTSDMRALPDYVVQGRIKRFEQVLGTPPAVVAEIEMVLTTRDVDKPLMLKNYLIERRIGDDRPATAIRELNMATEDVFAGFVADVSRLPVPSLEKRP
ncbi:MAG: PqiC family protein [Rhodospirillales bacterium]|nr:PqiC family protein [Rhodospirillales bacterium]